jgi:putative zinc finger/helix-turn-helix YgiT family protein
MSQSYCETCGSFVDPDVIARDETYSVKGESITVPARIAICPVSGDELSNETLDDETLSKAFAVYRARRGLLQPEEIKSIRLRYGLGQKAFARLLGWGEMTLHRYEMGSLQNPSQNTLLELARDPRFVQSQLARNGEALSSQQQADLRARLAELLADCAEPVSREESAEYLANASCEAKMREMMVYFAGYPDTFRTKFNKLVFYADFLHQKRWGAPISNLRYVNMQYGPVPVGFYQLQGQLVDDAGLRETEVDRGDWSGTVFVAGRPADVSVFSPSELECVEYVAEYFDGWTAKRISELTHSETAWRETQDRETISYLYADQLSLD